ncbi:MAG: sulfatase-like hydrolase/transferase [Planctomycetaceae bacterium]
MSSLDRRGQWRLGLIAGLLALAVDVEGAESLPNILLIVTDDQRADTIHALGNDRIRTPALDRLVREGLTFTRAVTASPICVASRAELLTGRDGLRNGHHDYGFTPVDNVRCLAEVLRDAGYATCYTGKWHTTGRPSTRGYATAAGLFAGGGEALPLTYPTDWRGRPVTGYVGWVFQTDDGTLRPELGVGLTPDISTVLANAALEFLSLPRDGPFFLHDLHCRRTNC